jgi:hypothetical protein
MDRSLIRRQVLPFVALFVGLLLATLAADLLLHRLGLIWLGRWLGIPGTLMILASFLYSMRKRKLISFGSPGRLLALHETFTWLGSLLVLVHAGAHFSAILPWLAVIAMVTNVGSGLIGKLLLDRSRQHLTSRREILSSRGLEDDEVEREIFWDAVTLDLMKKWRAVHFPITVAFAVLASGHVVSILLFWQWK